MSQTPYQIVFITAPSAEEAERIAAMLVEEGMAACVNMTECRSVYRWKGEIVKDPEMLMLAKIRRDRFADVERRLTVIHSYDVPELIAVDLSTIADGYRAFLEDVLGTQS